MVAHVPAQAGGFHATAAPAADAATQLTAALSGGDGLLGGALPVALMTLGGLILGGLRLSRGILRASRSIARTTKPGGGNGSFEERLAERLRELQQATPVPPAVPSVPAPATPPAPVTPAAVRTFGRRAR